MPNQAVDDCGTLFLDPSFFLVSYIVRFLNFLFDFVDFPVTRPGTHAWRSAITWGKPAFETFGHPSVSAPPSGLCHPSGFFSGSSDCVFAVLCLCFFLFGLFTAFWVVFVTFFALYWATFGAFLVSFHLFAVFGAAFGALFAAFCVLFALFWATFRAFLVSFHLFAVFWSCFRSSFCRFLASFCCCFFIFGPFVLLLLLLLYIAPYLLLIFL